MIPRFRFRHWRLRAALAGVLVAAQIVGASERVREALRESLPRYDPAIRAAAEASQANPAARKTPPVEGKDPVAATKPTPSLEVTPGVVVLAPVEVKARRQIPRVNLPRIEATPAVDSSVETADPYLLPAERRARLQKKHLSTLDRALNKFSLGVALTTSADGRATEAEQRERFAKGAGDVADALQLAAAAGESEAELKQLRELYLQLLTTRPK